MQIAYEAAEQPDRTFYRVVREGNYTSFPGFYGFLMRDCNTLPLSSDSRTLRKFTEAGDMVIADFAPGWFDEHGTRSGDRGVEKLPRYADQTIQRSAGKHSTTCGGISS